MSAANPPAGSAAAVPPGDAPPDPRRWLILAVIALAQLMIVLDATIVNIALPSAQRDLHFSTADRQWVVTAYALAFGSLLLLGGKVSSLLGRKVTFISGLIGFAAASAVGGAATSFGMLVAARALQGAFGAFMAPSALSLLTTTFSGSRDRGRAFGIFGAIAGSGAAIGLLLGGVLTEYLSWRWCLYVNLIFAAVAVTGAALLLGRHPRTHRPRLDLTGALFVSSGMFCIVYGFSNAATHNWHTPSTWGFLVAGVALLAVFAWWEARTAEPLLPLRVVLDRNRGGAYLSILIAGSGMFGIFLFITYYLQLIKGYSPVATGLAFLPLVAMIMIFANLSNIVLLPRFGPKPLVTLGMIFAACGMAWLTRIGVHSSYVSAVLPPLMIDGAGIGLIIAPSINTGTFGVPAEDAGVASASVNTGQQLGGSIGTSLLNTVAASATAAYLTAHVSQGSRAGGHPGPALSMTALVHGYTAAFWWGVGIFAFGALVAAVLFRWGPLASAGEPVPAEAAGTAARGSPEPGVIPG
jgi:EmrB/QacA subfamily drug resistance transporter